MHIRRIRLVICKNIKNEPYRVTECVLDKQHFGPTGYTTVHHSLDVECLRTVVLQVLDSEVEVE